MRPHPGFGLATGLPTERKKEGCREASAPVRLKVPANGHCDKEHEYVVEVEYQEANLPDGGSVEGMKAELTS